MKVPFLLCCFLGSVSFVNAQSLETISGTVTGDDDIENIHVINKTSKRFTTTNAKGAFFIAAKLHDTIVFSAIQYTTQEIIIDASILTSKSMHVNLNEEVNQLREVIVGKILTGNLMLDIGNATEKPDINFYDVGIPGYMGKRKTQQERLLQEAGEFKPKMLLGVIGGAIPINPIINGLTGRTKMLKEHVAMERSSDLITKIRQRLSLVFFSEHPLDENNRMDFWYFCSKDSNFLTRCKGKRDVEILAYINAKYIQYINNLNSTSN
ncbi:carboxypeptidase-like regulatory domain-containing protein [Formosa sp. L2A11]|uniref:carboxypeptidase-like regulatory domain-containing protein n=1 Tax=Formosa sp. L2A11 TaxID=2686363 RepID=UPI00131DCEAD|nr:carboxypeptidase-like regulatory domain-containing protein [Formosa sp. L2A11]